MIIYLLSLESDAQLETSHEGSGYEYEPEPEPESKDSGNDYFDDLYSSKSDEDDGKIVVVTEKPKSQNGKDYMDDFLYYGKHDSDPPSFDQPFADLKEGDNRNDYQDFMLWKH